MLCEGNFLRKVQLMEHANAVVIPLEKPLAVVLRELSERDIDIAKRYLRIIYPESLIELWQGLDRENEELLEEVRRASAVPCDDLDRETFNELQRGIEQRRRFMAEQYCNVMRVCFAKYDLNREKINDPFIAERVEECRASVAEIERRFSVPQEIGPGGSESSGYKSAS